MNDKILPQLLDVARRLGADSYTSLSLILQLLCWWKLSKEQVVPEGHRFDALAEQGLSTQLEALRSLQPSTPFPFLDEGVWQNLRGIPDISPLIHKIRVLDAQGLLDALLLDDAIYWFGESRLDSFAHAPGLCDLLISLAGVNANHKVYIPWEISGQIAARAVRTGATVWAESQQPTTPAQILNLTGGSAWEMHPTDPVKAPLAIHQGKLLQFDAAVCAPPMNVNYSHEVAENDLWGRFVEKTPAGNVLQIRHLLAQTHGRIVVMVPNSVLFGKGAEKQLREDLIKHGYLQAVVALPPGLCSHTSIPVNILVLNSDHRSHTIRFVNANADEFREVTAKRRCELKNIARLVQLVEDGTASPMAISVMVEEIAANDFGLEVGRYVLDESTRQLNTALERYPTRKLGELFEILRPRQHATASSGAEVMEVLAQDLPQFGYIHSAGKETLFDLDSPKADTYFIRPNDILMTFKGVVGKAGIAGPVPNPGDSGWIAGQSLVVLRSRFPEIYPPEALLIYLRSAMGQGLLSRMAVGASIPSIQLSALKEMQIPVASIEEMQTMAHAFDEEAQIQMEIEQLRIRQAELTKDFWSLE
ncbi:type I restriction-modification system subunit M/S [Pseudomonas sp. OTU5201]|uniref:type I restriction-modification system subunit M/S n=1 Tax=Pseudomonas sp. OTU5201 TaxID=3043850 RepID=UPI00313A7F2F